MVTLRKFSKHERGLKVTKLFSAYKTFHASKFSLWECWNNFLHLSIFRLLETSSPSSIFHHSRTKVPSSIFSILKRLTKYHLPSFSILNRRTKKLHLSSFQSWRDSTSTIFHLSQSWRDEQKSWIFHLWHSWTRAYKVPSVIFKVRKPTKRMNLQLYNNLNSENNVSQIKDKYN